MYTRYYVSIGLAQDCIRLATFTKLILKKGLQVGATLLNSRLQVDHCNGWC